MGSFWGDVLHNSLKEAKALPGGIVKGTAKLGEDLVKSNIQGFQHPERSQRNSPFMKDAKGMGQQYVDIAEHPLRQFRKGPISTTLAVLPFGKAATVGLEAGAKEAMVASMRAGGPEGLTNTASKVAWGASKVNKASSLKPAVKAAKGEAELWKAMKYNPGDGAPGRPYIGGDPGHTVDEGLLGKLHAQLGHPNTTYSVDFPAARDMPRNGMVTKGAFDYKSQNAATFLHQHHLGGQPMQASDDLSKTMLHEARHGYQQANWPRIARFADSHLPYNRRFMEKDANKFADEQAQSYLGLVKPDASDPRIPADRLPQSHNAAAEQLGTDVHTLTRQAQEVNKGMVGTNPLAFMNHLQKLVKDGTLQPDDAMDIESHLFAGDENYAASRAATPNSPKQKNLFDMIRQLPEGHPVRQQFEKAGRGSYEPPKSAEDMLTRAHRARSEGRTPETISEHAGRLLDGDGWGAESMDIYLKHRNDIPARVDAYRQHMVKAGYPDDFIKHVFGK